MNDFLGTLLLAILSSGAVTGIVTFVLTRRKYRAEIANIESQTSENKAQEADTFAGTIQKMIAIQGDLQTENAQLYKNNVALEKMLTDSDRARENLTLRLQARDDQISTLNRQLKNLQNKDQQFQITEALNAQLAAVTEIRQSYENIIQDRERTIRELMARTGQTGPLSTTPREQTKKKSNPARSYEQSGNERDNANA